MQKNKCQFVIIAPLLIVFLWTMHPTATLQAQVQARSGVRSDAMGGAFVAVSNDVNALHFSPAGLLNAPHRTQLELSHHRLFPALSNDLYLTSVGVIRSLFFKIDTSKSKLRPKLLVESSATVLASPPLQADKDPDTLLHRLVFGAQWQGLQLPGRTSQNTFTLSASIGLNGIGLLHQRQAAKHEGEPMARRPNQLALGISARYIHFGYDKSYLLDPNGVNDQAELDAINQFIANHKINASDFALDASLAVCFSQNFQAAASTLNLKKPNLAAKSAANGQKATDGEFGRRYRIGAAWRALDNLLVAADVEWNEDLGSGNVYGGVEYIYAPLALRSGFNCNWLAAGLGLQIRQPLIFNLVYQHSLYGHDLSNLRFAFDFAWR